MLALHTEVKTPASVFWSTETSRQFVHECSASMFSTIFSSQFLKAPNALSSNTAKMFLIISHVLTITGLNFPVPFWNLMPNTKKQISYKLLNVLSIINQHWLWLHLVQHQDVLSLFALRCQLLVSITHWKATHYSWITESTKNPRYSLRHLFMHQKWQGLKELFLLKPNGYLSTSSMRLEIPSMESQAQRLLLHNTQGTFYQVSSPYTTVKQSIGVEINSKGH